MFTIKVQVKRNTAHRPSTQASYATGTGMTIIIIIIIITNFALK